MKKRKEGEREPIKITYVLPFFALVTLLGALISSCATTPPAPDAPYLENLQFTPNRIAGGQPIEMSFDYRNIRGGLRNAAISLDYMGTLPSHTLKPSVWWVVIQKEGGEQENGTFRGKISPSPTDPPPFSIWYFLQVKDADGRKSNKVKAVMHYH